jgi:hypothetical protein
VIGDEKPKKKREKELMEIKRYILYCDADVGFLFNFLLLNL